MPAYIEKLRNYSPDYIDAYPSSLYILADYAVRNGFDLKGITKGITTSAETVFSEQREVIETSFGVPVADQYGAAEMCIFVGQCPEGAYHLHTDFGVVELINDDGIPAEDGEPGEVVCTGFINQVMPLIRYRIGDRAVFSNKTCACASPFRVLETLLGRIDDMILTPDGRRVGRLSPVLKGFPIKEAQYVQRDIHSLTVNVVRDTGYAQETSHHVVSELRKRLGDQIEINVRFVDEIAHGAGGKLRSIVSEIKNSGPG